MSRMCRNEWLSFRSLAFSLTWLSCTQNDFWVLFSPHSETNYIPTLLLWPTFCLRVDTEQLTQPIASNILRSSGSPDSWPSILVREWQVAIQATNWDLTRFSLYAFSSDGWKLKRQMVDEERSFTDQKQWSTMTCMNLRTVTLHDYYHQGFLRPLFF